MDMASFVEETVLLSDLFKQSRCIPHSDFIATRNYIMKRLDNLPAVSSEFNNRVRLIKRILPFSFLCKLFYRLRYDVLIGFYDNQGKREIYGMISFQKHPSRSMIGMFDIYMSSDLSNHFHQLSMLVYGLIVKFRESGYEYLQCGMNETTRKLLVLFEKICRRNHWDCKIDVEKSRIYLR